LKLSLTAKRNEIRLVYGFRKNFGLAANGGGLGVYRGLPPYKVASWAIQPFGHNRHEPKSGGLCAALRGAGSSSNTMCRGLRPQGTWAVNWGQLCTIFFRGDWVPIQHNVAWDEAYLPTKWHLDPSSQWMDQGEGYLCIL